VYYTGITEWDIMTGIGSKEAELIAYLSDKRKRVFSIAEAAEIMGISRTSASDLALRLLKKKKLIRIEKAKYLIVPPEAWKTGEYTEEGIILASQIVKPYYISYWTALSFYGWTEQPSRTIFIATTKSKKTIELQGTNFKFVRLRSNRFFGFNEQWVGNQKVSVADKEKTIVDCLDQPRYCGEIVEVVKGIWNGRQELSFEKIIEYARTMNNGAIIKRLGFLMDMLEIHKSKLRKEMMKNLTSGYVALDPDSKIKGTYNKEWNLSINVNVSNLTEWRTH
jgi:predicted transcriptional regulator of viral defense system